MKVSYCCAQSVGNIIKSHNKKLINNSNNYHVQPCNCRKCRTENITYKCIVSTSGHPDKVYLGTAEEDFRKIYYNHIGSFKNETQMNKTTSAKNVWEQKQRHNIISTLKWYTVKSVPSYSNIRKATCYACTKSLEFWPSQTKTSYWTKDQNLFLNVVILIGIYCPTIKLVIEIPFDTFRIIA